MSKEVSTSGEDTRRLCHLFPVDLLFSKAVFGARIAHGDLLKALARYGVHRRLLLAMDFGASDLAPALPAIAEREIQNLKHLGLDVSVLSLLEFSPELVNSNCVVISSGQESVRMLAARNLYPGGSAPICTLCHSLVWSDFVASYLTAGQLSRTSDFFVVPSRAGGDAVRECFEFSASAALCNHEFNAVPEIRQIPYGIFAERFGNIGQQKSRTLLEIPKDRLVLTYVGRLADQHKADLDVLLVVAQRLQNRGLRPYLVIAGSEVQDGYRAELETHSRILGILPLVRFIVDFDEALKPLVYDASDICVFPADNLQETYGLAILEAMASGRPVVASRWSGYQELVIDGETGFLVDCSIHESCTSDIGFLLAVGRPTSAEAFAARRTVVDVDGFENAITLLAENEVLRQKCGEAGRVRVQKHFCWSIVLKQFEQLWEEQRERARKDSRDQSLPAHKGNRERQASRFLSAFVNHSTRPLALLPNSLLENIPFGQEAVMLGLLPLRLRSKARECLRLLNDRRRILWSEMDPELQTAAWTLIKKGFVRCEYDRTHAPGIN